MVMLVAQDDLISSLPCFPLRPLRPLWFNHPEKTVNDLISINKQQV